jgi:hypothetical protein
LTGRQVGRKIDHRAVRLDPIRLDTMRKFVLMTVVIAFGSSTTGTTAALAQTDTQLRTAFCMGVLDKAIEDFARPMPSMYGTPDGKGYTPPGVAHAQQAYAAKAIRELSDTRERLRRFLLPALLGSDVLPLRLAKKEGAEVMQACGDGIAENEACVRMHRCSNLEWLPY